ncbi:AfsR/SARP family transcriptional regulator [Cryptosporangium minutisporangium]|uniref:AfsR/SARP family transcriptional regulator n=1 Tax=Cryptosporangium minutisporangium TaxID=113569 RepID=UPI0031E551F5
MPISAARESALLAELVAHLGQPVTREHLAEGIWSGRVRHPAHAVHALVSRLRHRLSLACTEVAGAVIVTRGACYALHVADDAVDGLRFQALVLAARQAVATGAYHRGSGLYDDALELWQGPALSGAAGDSPCVQAERSRLEELRVTVLEERAQALLRVGAHRALVTELLPLVDAYPLREGLRAALMLALYRSGRVGEALAAYRAAREHLVEHVGVGPGAELRHLHARMLSGDLRDERESPPHAVELADRPAESLGRLIGELRMDQARLETRIRRLEARLAGRPRSASG